MKSGRLFEIIYILLGREFVKARELAERFEVTTRTIYRDIDALSSAGIPVYAEKGKLGGFSLLPGFVLNKTLLNEQEQNEILLALQGLASVKTEETESILQKLSVIFNKSAVNWLKVDFTDWSIHNDYYFNDFKTAILERRIVEFDYYSASGVKTHRRIEPVQIIFKSRSWYIKGFCLKKQDLRLFKMVRAKKLKLTDETFIERDFLTLSLPEEEPPKLVDLKLKIAPGLVYRIYDEFDESVVEEQADGSYLVTVSWKEDNWMLGVIMSFGEYIEVLEPDYIRELVRDKASRLAENNRSS